MTFEWDPNEFLISVDPSITLYIALVNQNVSSPVFEQVTKTSPSTGNKLHTSSYLTRMLTSLCRHRSGAFSSGRCSVRMLNDVFWWVDSRRSHVLRNARRLGSGNCHLIFPILLKRTEDDNTCSDKAAYNRRLLSYLAFSLDSFERTADRLCDGSFQILKLRTNGSMTKSLSESA